MSEVEIINMDSNNERMANTMSKSGFTFYSALNELVDNSTGTAKNITISLVVENHNQRPIKKIIISDDGSGIPKEQLRKAFGMGVMTGKTIHEHGVGMKTSIAYFGGLNIRDGLESISSYDGKDSYKVISYEGNNLSIKKLPVPTSTGTTIVANVKEQTAAANRVQTLIEKLGIRYAIFVDRLENSITVQEVDEATGKVLKNKSGKDTIHEVKPIYPPYYHPISETKVHILHKRLTTADLVADLTIGLTPEDEDGAWARKSYGGGIDVVQNERVICHREYDPISEWRPVNHTSLNALCGRLVIQEGHLDTTPKKDALQASPQWTELKNEVAKAIKVAQLGHFFSAPPEEEVKDDQITEAQIEANLIDFLNDLGYTKVVKQSELKYGFRTDVEGVTPQSEGCIWEVKKKGVVPNDVLQLVNYMKIKNITKGVLVAPGWGHDGEKYLKEVWPDMSIELWDVTRPQYRILGIKEDE
jgi:hypothetical protein